MDDRGVEPSQLAIDPAAFAQFVKLIAGGVINRGTGKVVFEAMFEAGPGFDPERFVQDNNLAQVNDEALIASTVQAVLDENPKTVEQYHAGQQKVFGFLVGQAMKRLKGKASPEIVNKALREALGG